MAAVLFFGVVCAERSLAQERVLCVDRPDTSWPRNDYYDGNREPLLPSPLIVEGVSTVLTFRPLETTEMKMELIADRDVSAGPCDWVIK